MLEKTTYSRQKGFSLIELLIVIIIISVVYFLGFSGIEKVDKKEKALTPLTLKSSITKSEFFYGEGTLMCINKCKDCYFRKNISSPYEKYENNINLHDIEAYTVDYDNNLLKLEFGRYDDKKVCLILDFYTNGSSTQIILKQKNNVYFLPSFFGKPIKADSIEDAKKFWLKDTRVLSSGSFY